MGHAEAYKPSKRRFFKNLKQTHRRPEQVTQSDLSSESDDQEYLPRKKEEEIPCWRWTNLEGPGPTSSKVNGPHFVLDDIDITSTLMAKREQLIPLESDLIHVHDLLNGGSENEGTYQKHFVDPIFTAFFSNVNLTTGWNQYRLSTPPDHIEDLSPDFLAMKSNLPLVVAEVKRPGASLKKMAKDRQRLGMMKLSLNMMLRKRVEDPVVIGVVVQDSFFEIMAMGLTHEALYIPKVLGSFQVPTCPGGLAALHSALPALAAAKDYMEKPQASISSDHPMVVTDFDDVRTRDSFYLRRAKIPVGNGK
ncbi:hypothetical protein BGZ54_002645 [Gamsiella multidivaricata]|nr:hypothetical protein BGZ54_002645 [Gamsiella multidivaricata]